MSDKQTCDQCGKELRQLLRENRVLREALAFYAEGLVDGKSGVQPKPAGATAREAIYKLTPSPSAAQIKVLADLGAVLERPPETEGER